MKVEVTSLKANWPAGTKLGDVFDMDGDVIPAWLVGKCKPAEQAQQPAAAPAPAQAASRKKS